MSVTNLCPHCGTNQRAGARFCRECGKHLATPPATPPAAAPSPPQVVPPPPAPLSGQAPYPAGEPAVQTGEAKTKLYMRPLFWVIMVAVLGLCTCLAGALIGTLSKGDGFDFISLGGSPSETEAVPTEIPATETARPPTATAPPPTATSLPPTDTPVPPTATDDAIAGIDKPIQVEGAELQFVSVKRQSSYDFGSGSSSQKFTAKSPDDELLVVEMDVLSSGSADLGKMAVVVIDENGRESKPNLITTTFDSGSINSVKWIFVVSRASEIFVLEFPDGQEIAIP